MNAADHRRTCQVYSAASESPALICRGKASGRWWRAAGQICCHSGVLSGQHIISFVDSGPAFLVLLSSLTLPLSLQWQNYATGRYSHLQRRSLPALSLVITRIPSYPSPHWHLICTAHARSKIATSDHPSPQCIVSATFLPTQYFYRYSIMSSYQYERPSLVDWAMSALHHGFRAHVKPNSVYISTLMGTTCRVRSSTKSALCHAPYTSKVHMDVEGPVTYGVRFPPRGHHTTELQKCGISTAARSLAVWCSLSNSGARNAGTLLVHHGAPAPGRQHSVFFMIFGPRGLEESGI
jgi:hypothetical protein